MTANNNGDSRESLEASIIFSDGEGSKDGSAKMRKSVFSDEDWEGYSTPTGSPMRTSSKVSMNSKPSTVDAPLITSNKTATEQEEPVTFTTVLSTTMEDPSSPNFLDQSFTEILDENAALKKTITEMRSEYEKKIDLYDNAMVKLQEQLDEANSYVDQVDVEAEQQFSELTREIDELCDLLEKGKTENQLLKEQNAEHLKTQEKMIEQQEREKSQIERQSRVIESLRDELDDLKEKMKEVTSEKEKVLTELTTTKEKSEIDRNDVLAKEVLLQIEMEDMQRELQRQKDILESTSASQLSNKFERRVLDLENRIRERDVMLHRQQQIINELRKIGHHGSHTNGTLNSAGSSSESFGVKEFDRNGKSQVLQFILSDRNSQLANIYALGRVLDLSSEEENYLERSLNDRRNRFA